MTTYTTLVVSDFDPEQPITTQKANAWYYNCVAITEGSSGAPKIQQSAISSSAVGQAQIKTATASSSVTVPGGSNASIALTGGTYSMWTASSLNGCAFGNGNTAAGTIGFFDVGGGGFAYVDERYFQASPPYNLGDGEIPLFVYLLVNSNGDIIGHSESPDPIWVNHGPTNVKPDFYDFINGKNIPMQWVWIYPEEVQTEREKARYRRSNEPDTAIEVDYHADMDVFPHPFVSIKGNQTAIMIDPVSDLIESLRDAHDSKENMRDLILNGISIDNVPLARKGPSSISIVKGRIK